MGDAKLLTLGLGVRARHRRPGGGAGAAADALRVPVPLALGHRQAVERVRRARLWILGYVAVSQVGLLINTRVLTAVTRWCDRRTRNAWLLFQLPYGVIGVSLLTAILPRMSRAAADGDHKQLVDDLSLRIAGSPPCCSSRCPR